jgi:3-hydroxyisobutyrate dehydrogenase-like beta-hydroxyacid dehydrogenase
MRIGFIGAATIEFAKRLNAQGIEMLDAPVSGGEAGAMMAPCPSG